MYPYIPRPCLWVCLYTLNYNRLNLTVPVQIHIKLGANQAQHARRFGVIYSESPGVNHGCSLSSRTETGTNSECPATALSPGRDFNLANFLGWVQQVIMKSAGTQGLKDSAFAHWSDNSTQPNPLPTPMSSYLSLLSNARLCLSVDFASTKNTIQSSHLEAC